METNTKKYVEIHSKHFVGMILLFDYILYLQPIMSSTTMRCSNCGTLNSFRHLVRVYAKTCNNWRSTCSYPNILVCANCLIGYLIPALRTTGWELGTVLVYDSEIHMHQILFNDGVQEWVDVVGDPFEAYTQQFKAYGQQFEIGMSQINKKSFSRESSRLSSLVAGMPSRGDIGKQHFHKKKKQQEELSFNEDEWPFVHPYMSLYPMVVAPTPAPEVAVAASSAVVCTGGIQSSAHIHITEDDCWLI